METGRAISIINTGYLPFIPLTTQYTMGMLGPDSRFLVPTTKNLSEIGKMGTLDWGWSAKASNSIPFQPQIDRYDSARSGQQRDAEPGYGLYDEKLQAPGAFAPEKFQQKDLRGKQDTNQLHQDLGFTPNASMAARSTAMAAELAQIVEATNAPTSTSIKEDAEMEEEAILDLFYTSDVPELQAIMQEARAKADAGETSVITNSRRNELGLSHETYDWSIKDVEDMTKMHALISVINENMKGDLLSDNIIGLEVTKDIKFFAKDVKREDYNKMGLSESEMTQRFLETTREKVGKDMERINKQIKVYLETSGHMRDAMVKESTRLGHFKMVKGKPVVDPHAFHGFTIQVISRARETMFHPGESNSYAFQYPEGTKAQGGPYQVILELTPVIQDGVLQSINHTVGIVEMEGYEGARSKMQPGIANLLLKHMNDTLQLDTKVTTEILTRAASLVGTELQLLAGRGSMLGTRFETDFAMFMGNTYLAYTTMTSTMSSKEISESLHDMIMNKAGSPEQQERIKKMIETMVNDDSRALTAQWKDKVGGNDYTVPEYVWARNGGPWSGEAGEGVSVVPFLGSSRQMNLMEAIQKNPKGQVRVGQAVKNPVRRMTGAKPTPTDALKTRSWMDKAFGLNPSETGFEAVTEGGVIRMRESWFKKYGASKNMREFNPYKHKI